MIFVSSRKIGHGRTWAKAILLGEHSVVYGHPAVALPLHDLQMRATAAPVHGPSRLRCLDYCGPIARAGPRFACIARAFEAAREFSGCLDLSFEITTRSDFPHERGLGSSAAAAGAIIRAVLDACRRDASTNELFALRRVRNDEELYYFPQEEFPKADDFSSLPPVPANGGVGADTLESTLPPPPAPAVSAPTSNDPAQFKIPGQA